jgi:hypothetical protein
MVENVPYIFLNVKLICIAFFHHYLSFLPFHQPTSSGERETDLRIQVGRTQWVCGALSIESFDSPDISDLFYDMRIGGGIPCSILSSQSGHSHSSGATELSSRPAHAQWTLLSASTYSCGESHTGRYTIVSYFYNDEIELVGLTISQTISCYPHQSLIPAGKGDLQYSP